jgi:hypothetical protein
MYLTIPLYTLREQFRTDRLNDYSSSKKTSKMYFYVLTFV